MTTNPADPQPPEQPATRPASIELGEQPGAELRTELAAAGRPTSKVTLILVGVVVLVVGFLGGILTHRAYAGSGTSNTSNAAGGPNGTGNGNGLRGYRFPGASGAPNGGNGN